MAIPSQSTITLNQQPPDNQISGSQTTGQQEHNQEFEHPGITHLKSRIKPNDQVLEINAQSTKAGHLNYPDESFDIVYSLFNLEKTHHPEQILTEMIRVLKKGGHLFILTPNFGAPMRKSPHFLGNRLYRAYHRINQDIWYYVGLKKQHTLDWLKVDPKELPDHKLHKDTIIEPYIIPLISFLQLKGLIMNIKSTCWDISEPHERITNKIFRFLGNQDLYPFKYWGPHIYIEAQKQDLHTSHLNHILHTIVHWIKITSLIIIIILPFTPVLLTLWVIAQKLIYSIVRQLSSIKKSTRL